MPVNSQIKKHEKQIDKLLQTLLTQAERDLLNQYDLSGSDAAKIVRRLYEGLPELTAEEIKKGAQLTSAKQSGDFQKALNSIKADLKRLNEFSYPTIDNTVLNAYGLSYYGEGWAFENPTSLNFGFQELSEDRFNNVRYSKKYKRTWRTRNGQNIGRMFNKIEDTLTQGLNSGAGVLKTASQVKKVFVEFDVVDRKRRVKGGFADARRIVRTETHRTLNQGRTDAYRFAEKSGKRLGVELRRVLDAVLDSRTRPQSAQMDNQVADKDGFFTYPGGIKSDTPGNTGIAAFDINDRETTRTEMFNEDGSPLTEQPQGLTFRKWAEQQGITKNKFNQDLFKPIKI